MSTHRFSENGLLSIRDFGSHRWYGFYCPGCRETHNVQVGMRDDWKFNGSEQEPTFSPSILVRGVKSAFPPFDPTPKVCHSYISLGVIDYLPDSTHELAGKRVAMVPIPASQHEMLKNCVEPQEPEL